MRALLLASAIVCSTAAAATPSQSSATGEMQAFELNGYDLLNAEYLAFVGQEPVHYPSDVLWGFYAAGTTDAARGCALRAYRQIKAFFTDNPTELQDAVAYGAVSQFFLWVDDYTAAATSRSRREARLWHWNSDGRDYTRGYWKWEAVVTQSGVCQLPDLDDAREALQRAADDLSS